MLQFEDFSSNFQPLYLFLQTILKIVHLVMDSWVTIVRATGYIFCVYLVSLLKSDWVATVLKKWPPEKQGQEWEQGKHTWIDKQEEMK